MLYKGCFSNIYIFNAQMEDKYFALYVRFYYIALLRKKILSYYVQENQLNIAKVYKRNGK